MKFTKKQRHEIYKEALVLLKKGNTQKKGYCLCFCLNEIINKSYKYTHCTRYHPGLYNMKEFIKKKPKNMVFEQLWWNRENRPIRVRVLNKCIKETAPNQ